MFSKEGLAREQKVDPKEAAKGKTRDWVGNAIGALNTQMESFDADLERLSAGKGACVACVLLRLSVTVLCFGLCVVMYIYIYTSRVSWGRRMCSDQSY